MNMEFGIRLKKLIKENGSSQKELASKLKKDDQTVSRWVTGQTYPDASDIIKISEILHISIAEIFGQPVGINEMDPRIPEALKDPLAVKALLLTFKNKQDSKEAIAALLETLPTLSPEKRQAILALYK